MSRQQAIVVGGGVHGASVFYHLLSLGLERVLLVERKSLACAATGRSTGIIRHHYSHEVTVRVARYSSRVFSRFPETMGRDIGYVNNGLVFLATREEEGALRRCVEQQRRLGVDASLVDPAGLKTLHPDLVVDDVPLASFERDAGYADPYSVTVGYAKAGEALGGKILLNAAVQDIRRKGDGFLVATASGEHEADAVVLAAGAWARTLGARMGVDIPVTPLRLSNAVLELPGGYARTTPTVLDLPNHLYFRPEGGHILVGDGEGLGDADPETFDESLPYGFVEEVSERVVRRIPRFADAAYRTGWRGLDGASPDFHPIVGPLPDVDGAYVSVGMSGHGFKLAPGIGRCLAERVVHGRYETIDLAPYAPDRFARGRALTSLFSMRILA